MTEVIVAPEELERVADVQDQAAKKAGAAAKAGSEIKTALWMTHGVASTTSNNAITDAAGANRTAGDALQKACTRVAESLRKAAAAYQNTDQQTGRNLDEQVFDR